MDTATSDAPSKVPSQAFARISPELEKACRPQVSSDNLVNNMLRSAIGSKRRGRVLAVMVSAASEMQEPAVADLFSEMESRADLDRKTVQRVVGVLSNWSGWSQDTILDIITKADPYK